MNGDTWFAIGALATPAATAVGTILIRRWLHHADSQRAAQTVMIAKIEGSVNTHGTDIAVLKTEVGGLRRDVDRITGDGSGRFGRRVIE